jgi:hypothetical protein
MYEGRLIEADKELAGLRNLNEHLQKELAGLGRSPNLKVVSKGYVDVLNDSEPSARNSALQKDTSRSGKLKQPETKSQRTEEERYSDVFFEDEAEGSDDSDDKVHVKTVPGQDEDSQDQASPSESEETPRERQKKQQLELSQSESPEESHEESYEPSQAEIRHRSQEASSSRSESIEDSFGGESDSSMD